MDIRGGEDARTRLILREVLATSGFGKVLLVATAEGEAHVQPACTPTRLAPLETGEMVRSTDSPRSACIRPSIEDHPTATTTSSPHGIRSGAPA